LNKPILLSAGRYCNPDRTNLRPFSGVFHVALSRINTRSLPRIGDRDIVVTLSRLILVQRGSPVSMEVTIGDLTWETFRQPFQPLQLLLSEPRRRLALLGRSMVREANATGLISGDIEFDLTNAELAGSTV
jgi:hypothetical protein